MNKLDMNARYSVKGFSGIAFYIYGYPKIWESFSFFDEYLDMEIGDGEWVEDKESGNILVVMVGDDHKWTVSTNDLTELNNADYCHGCGQIGCTAESGIYENN